MHLGTYNQTPIKYSLVEEIHNVSALANFATVVNTKEVTPINPKDDKCLKVLKRKTDEIIGVNEKFYLLVYFFVVSTMGLIECISKRVS